MENTTPQANLNNKNFLLTVALAYFAGSLGVDRFYLGYVKTGILKLLTFGGLGIWTLIDFLRICLGRMKAKGSAEPLEDYAKYAHPFKIIGWVVFVFHIILTLLFFGVFGWVTYQGLQDAADNQTYTRASFVAENMSQYIANNQALPDSLEQLIPGYDTTNLTYHKDSESAYTFCATYKSDNTQSTTVIADEYADSVYRDNQMLAISHKHTAGQNCRKMAPELVPTPVASETPAITAIPEKTPNESGCGLSSELATMHNSGYAGSLTRSAQTGTFTFKIAARNGGSTYSVASDAKVYDASCTLMDHAKVSEGDVVHVFGDPSAQATPSVTGQTIKALVVVDQTSH